MYFEVGSGSELRGALLKRIALKREHITKLSVRNGRLDIGNSDVLYSFPVHGWAFVEGRSLMVVYGCDPKATDQKGKVILALEKHEIAERNADIRREKLWQAEERRAQRSRERLALSAKQELDQLLARQKAFGPKDITSAELTELVAKGGWSVKGGRATNDTPGLLYADIKEVSAYALADDGSQRIIVDSDGPSVDVRVTRLIRVLPWYVICYGETQLKQQRTKRFTDKGPRELTYPAIVVSMVNSEMWRQYLAGNNR